MQSDPTLSAYLYDRKLQDALEIDKSLEAAILADEEMLAKIAGLVGTYEPALDALLRLRAQSIIQTLALAADPSDTIILRQALVEVGAIGDDARRLAEEWKRREALKEANAVEEAEPPEPAAV